MQTAFQQLLQAYTIHYTFTVNILLIRRLQTNVSFYFTARCTIVQSAVLRLHVVRLSVCPSVTRSTYSSLNNKETKAIHIKLGNLVTLYKTIKIDAFNTVLETQQ